MWSIDAVALRLSHCDRNCCVDALLWCINLRHLIDETTFIDRGIQALLAHSVKINSHVSCTSVWITLTVSSSSLAQFINTWSISVALASGMSRLCNFSIGCMVFTSWPRLNGIVGMQSFTRLTQRRNIIINLEGVTWSGKDSRYT